jgi:hypothetical protein
MAEKEKLLTRYLIFETDENAVTFTRVGEQLANGAEEALRKHYGSPPSDREGFNVAVSENSFKLRKARARVTTSLEDVELPGLAAENQGSPLSEEEREEETRAF